MLVLTDTPASDKRKILRVICGIFLGWNRQLVAVPGVLNRDIVQQIQAYQCSFGCRSTDVVVDHRLLSNVEFVGNRDLRRWHELNACQAAWSQEPYTAVSPHEFRGTLDRAQRTVPAAAGRLPVPACNDHIPAGRFPNIDPDRKI